MTNIVFKVKKWLDDEEFSELLKISDYLGREYGYSVFSLNIPKAVKNGFYEDDILEILKKHGVSLTQKELETLKLKLSEELEKSLIRIELSYSDGMILIKPDKYLGDALSGIRDLLVYDKINKIFKTYPIHYLRVKEYLSSLNTKLEDKTGFTDKNLPIKPALKLNLRDYQSEALDKWISNKYRGIIALPTGSGKTIVGLAAVSKLAKWTLVVAFTKEQVKQWREHFVKNMNLSSSDVGVFYGEEKIIAPITITTYQTAFRYIKQLAPYFPMIIVDECHHLPADKFREIAIRSFAPYRLGLSATPFREDGRHEELFPLLGGVIYYKSVKELAEKGYLAPFVIKVIKVNLTPEEMKIYKDLKKKYDELSRGLSFQELLALAKRGDMNAIEALKIRSQLRLLVHTSKEKINALRRVFLEELSKGSKIIIFTQYVDQAEEIGKILNIPVVTGETDPSTRKRNFDLFRSGFYKAIVLTSVGDEGIDVPDANVGIIVAGTGSRRQFIQRLGRLLRPMGGKEAVLYEIIVKNTFEEAESRRRRSALRELENQFNLFYQSSELEES
ncbi:MAG: DEAD/DEAH box helicase [Sulfolobales archaeon]